MNVMALLTKVNWKTIQRGKILKTEPDHIFCLYRMLFFVTHVKTVDIQRQKCGQHERKKNLQ